MASYGLFYSQSGLTALARQLASRQEAYVNGSSAGAMACWDKRGPLPEALQNDPASPAASVPRCLKIFFAPATTCGTKI
jgi:hypothetical protein